MVTDKTRRRLLLGALGSVALRPLSAIVAGGALGGCSRTISNGIAVSSVNDGKAAIVGCSRQTDGRYSVVVASDDGAPLYQVPLPDRGHGVALQSNGPLAAAFSRRPGSYLQIFDYRQGRAWPLYVAPANRHFYGHGVFSPDGQYLYATEGGRQTSQGIIGVYEVGSLASGRLEKVEEFSGFGIGPHEVVLADTHTLAIGVGGVHTRGRTPLNLDTMQPALVYLDRTTGEIVDKAVLADKQLSIRHLSVTDTGGIACGQQYRGLPEEAAPLVALHRKGEGETLKPLLAEEEQWLRFNHYIASIASLDGYLLVTSPRGNCYGIWHEASRELIELRPLVDASGVGVKGGKWLVGSGAGKVLSINPPKAVTMVQSPVIWDNHWNII
ncbi:DUF1513 domain-containing protein [Photobacterium sp. DNB23_23_1]|uniref:DUF1513 domain-containing protein n=1 Tax=Photobacterium pectinilyticum TaxID=2906793 RepID=A0ABT1N1Y1_9GAMM|nr:DUF1513 domain-containing protein [Photobacterium sp. ZSDE20]MCQ1057279.1 DUF1513 domain-containing protein [Photobacterium sp. ZSDE20]MDD1821738.1 DUF1513 domain-containing protein [Photobacterium sp. ZSDE20]